jgi:arabinofuranosyltransferase
VPEKNVTELLQPPIWRKNLLIVVAALLVTGAVYASAWMSDDAFLTLRYVSNTVHGYGPVFNVGEHVQGYTHPAWFILLVAGTLIFRDPVLVTFGFSFLLTFLTVVIVGRAYFRLCSNWLAGASLLAVTGLVWSSSDPWTSFQTSGLENPLAHFLLVCIVSETWIHSARRAGRLMLLLGLLCLTRPDFLAFVIPLVSVLVWRIRSARQFAYLLLGSAPVFAWLAFAWIFYHDIFPNTFYAKVGIYKSLGVAIGHGLAYLGDWFHYDTLAAGGTTLFFALAAWRARTAERIALLLGIAVYVVWIVQVGGDFMRGRFFMPVLTASIFAGGLTLAEQMSHPGRYLSWQLAGVCCVLASLWVVARASPEPPPNLDDLNIVNERKFYWPDYSLSYYLEHGSVKCPFMGPLAIDVLRTYAANCGPITIDSVNPGTTGYLLGPGVSIIDDLGLVDRYIAKLPREFLVDEDPRPGHPLKKIPRSYLASRGDVKLLPNWRERIATGDCSLTSDAKNLDKPDDQLVLP